MAERTRLTLERIRAFTCPPERFQAFLWDNVNPRLAVRATPNGGKAFVFEAKLGRRTVRRVIGDCTAWRIDEAREEANRLRRLIDTGVDPRDEVRERRERAETEAREKAAAEAAAAARERYTLAALCDAYVAHLEARGKTRAAGAARSVFRCHVKPHAIADQPAREIRPQEVATLVRRVVEAGKARSAAVLRSYLHAAFAAARKAPLAADLPAALIEFNVEHNPVEIVPTMPSGRGMRTLSAAELRGYLKALGAALPDRALRVALLAGGQRMAQLLRARVADWDADSTTLRLFDPKGRRTTPREHLVPLGPVCAALVTELADAARAAEAEWLFGGRGGEPLHFETAGKRVSEIARDLGGEPFNLRDVRRSVETQLAALGISRETRAQLLSHGLSGVQVAHYDRHDYLAEKRAALVAWEARLDEIENGPKKAKVVPLKDRRARRAAGAK